ncbi:hypothetical protein BDF19DRAFT_454929 [Syncephalis fuscata]|nr:hypothetical protein BDF19DRAFT_454929 [Syncephalis fuscata]
MAPLQHLLLVFVHGFRGDDTTFEAFPDRLRQVLTNSLRDVDVDAVVYPQYATRGDFTQAVHSFCHWLLDLTAERQKASKSKVNVILLGHSMGGLIVSDALQKLQDQPDNGSSLALEHQPTILALLAYDTPFFGLSSPFISRTAYTHANNWGGTFASTATLLSSAAVPAAKLFAGSRWKAAAGGGVLAAALLGTAFANRDKVKEGVLWASEHLMFAGTLMNEVEMRERVDKLHTHPNVQFRCYYNVIRASNGENSTFIHPPPSSLASSCFIPIPSQAKDEIDAHTTMFSLSNPVYYTLGDNSINFICDTVNMYLEKQKQEQLLSQ